MMLSPRSRAWQVAIRQQACSSVLVPLGVAAAIRVPWVGFLSLWGDEVYTMNKARDSLDAIVTLWPDAHPPLYYVVLHLWLQLVDAEWWARLLSVLLSMLTVLAVYWLGRLALGPRTASAAAWLTALSPWDLW